MNKLAKRIKRAFVAEDVKNIVLKVSALEKEVERLEEEINSFASSKEVKTFDEFSAGDNFYEAYGHHETLSDALSKVKLSNAVEMLAEIKDALNM